VSGRAAAVAVVATLSAVLAGCGSESPRADNAVPVPASAAERLVLAVLGGDETDDPPGGGSVTREWDQLVFAGLPTSSVLVDLADRRPTARTVARDQLPRAVGVHPTVATVWLGAADADAGTGDDAFESSVRQIVDGLTTAGTRHVLLLSRRADPPERADPGDSARYAPVLDRVAAATGARVVPLPGPPPVQATVAAAVRPYVTL
jgi:hypothetical protein